MLKYSKFVVWWISILLILTATFWSYYFGLINTILNNDPYKITTIIAAIFVLANIVLGYVSFKQSNEDYYFQNKEKVNKVYDMCWFVSEQLMAIGMFGTVIGLVHMLSTNLVGQNMNSETVQTAVGGMWSAMGFALYANAVGLITSIVLKIQVYFIGYDADET